MGVNQATHVEHPPLSGIGAKSASSGIGFPLNPQGASGQTKALTISGAEVQWKVTRRRILVYWQQLDFRWIYPSCAGSMFLVMGNGRGISSRRMLWD
jgi:hypothetical protein